MSSLPAFAFVGGITFVAVVVLLLLTGLVSALLLMVSILFAVIYGFTGSHHAGILTLVYLGYAAIPFVLAFVFYFYWFNGRRLLELHNLSNVLRGKPAVRSPTVYSSGLYRGFKDEHLPIGGTVQDGIGKPTRPQP